MSPPLIARICSPPAKKQMSYSYDEHVEISAANRADLQKKKKMLKKIFPRNVSYAKNLIGYNHYRPNYRIYAMPKPQSQMECAVGERECDIKLFLYL